MGMISEVDLTNTLKLSVCPRLFKLNKLFQTVHENNPHWTMTVHVSVTWTFVQGHNSVGMIRLKVAFFSSQFLSSRVQTLYDGWLQTRARRSDLNYHFSQSVLVQTLYDGWWHTRSSTLLLVTLGHWEKTDVFSQKAVTLAFSQTT